MADPGWYPDPNGTPQRLRYWDGTSWSGRTTFDPERPIPKRATATKTGGATKTKGRVPLVWLAGLLLLILIGVATVLIRQDPDDEPDIWSTSLTDSPIGQVSNLF